MNANPEFASFARLVESLRPWLGQVVIIGGWAHRLHRFHPLAQQLEYEPLATLDADVALPRQLRVAGREIYERLSAKGFEAEFLGHNRPPAAHYRRVDPWHSFLCRIPHATYRRCSHQTRKAECNTASGRHLVTNVALH